MVPITSSQIAPAAVVIIASSLLTHEKAVRCFLRSSWSASLMMPRWTRVSSKMMFMSGPMSRRAFRTGSGRTEVGLNWRACMDPSRVERLSVIWFWLAAEEAGRMREEGGVRVRLEGWQMGITVGWKRGTGCRQGCVGLMVRCTTRS